MFYKKIYVLVLVIVLLAACSSKAGEMSAISPDPSAAKKVVDDYYTWYLGYIGDRNSEEFRNPLVDQAYHNSDLLTTGFIEEVDSQLAGMKGGGFDPFLCAQDIPTEIRVKDFESKNGEIHVQMETNFADHAFTVILVQKDDDFLIDEINCE